MMPYCPDPAPNDCESLRLEGVTVCAGFDDVLEQTLPLNHPHFDTLIVVTSHDDKATQALCRKHSVHCVPTDLMNKDDRAFNKGAMINAGFQYFRFAGWRVHLDVDIVLPDNFRRLLFNHTHLEKDCLYGADRVDVIGMEGLRALREGRHQIPQHANVTGLSSVHGGAVYADMPSATSARYVSPLYGYCPLGAFTLWNALHHKEYPYPSGNAAGDDIRFAALWPEAKRRLLPTVVTYHVNSRPPNYGENWNGPHHRGQPRLDGKKK